MNKKAIIHWFMTQQIDRDNLYKLSQKSKDPDPQTRGLAFCAQWNNCMKYISPATNVELIGDPMLYLPMTDQFIFL